MMKRICRVCGEEFIPAVKHPGYINVCLEEDCRVVARCGLVAQLAEQDPLKVEVQGSTPCGSTKVLRQDDDVQRGSLSRVACI